MKKACIIAGITIMFQLSLKAQWVEVAHFETAISKILYQRDTIAAVTNDAIYYSAKPYESWQKANLSLYAGFDMVQTNDGFYFANHGELFRFSVNGNHFKISDVDSNRTLLSNSKEVLTVSCRCGYGQGDIVLKKINTKTGVATDQYVTTGTFYSSQVTAVANDSILIYKYVSSYGYYKAPFGTFLFNMNSNSNMELVNPNRIFGDQYGGFNFTNNEMSALTSNYFYSFFYTNDYGKTQIYKTLPNDMKLTSPITKMINGSSFIINLNNPNLGTNVWYSNDLGNTWYGKLNDTVITDAQVFDNTLYVLTNNNYLIKADNNVLGLQNNIEKIKSEVFYSNNQLTNNSISSKKIKVYDLKGAIWLEETLFASQSLPINLPKGVYIVKVDDLKEKLKIVVF